MPSVAASDVDAGPHPTTATVGQGKVLAEHGRRSGRNASAGEASSSEAERAGGQQRVGGQDVQVMRMNGIVSAAGCGGGLSRVAAGAARVAERAGKPGGMVTAPSDQPGGVHDI